jgi:hypothetical protein
VADAFDVALALAGALALAAVVGGAAWLAMGEPRRRASRLEMTTRRTWRR